MQQQFSRPLGLVIEAVALEIFRNGGVDQPDLAVLGIGVGFRDRAFAAADRLDLGAGQRNADLDRILDRIVEAGLAIFRHDLDRTFVLVGHGRQTCSRCARTLTVWMKRARQDFLRRSRISVSSSTSADDFGGAAGSASSLRFSLFMARITRNSTKA